MPINCESPHTKFPFHNLRTPFNFTVSDDVSQFCVKLDRDTVECREKNHINRNDFMVVLVKLKNQPTKDKMEDPFIFEELSAQAFVFFLVNI